MSCYLTAGPLCQYLIVYEQEKSKFDGYGFDVFATE